ncbi:YfhO family protein [Phaeacidiphilus oryzae]|uniref:YfhO family protein n=1 Tax=Phaeacidiphilus oryzae TaxID=348818 RepID=UPI0006924A9C|nr:YfhO family protein [Phaeacidiphilus oryzae]
MSTTAQGRTSSSSGPHPAGPSAAPGVRVRRLGLRRPGAESAAALLAALAAMAAFCIGTAKLNTYPFGSRGRAINDLGNQFVPFHAHLWDLMHGAPGAGDLLFNWNSGYGVPFLGDFLTYLANPFSWLTYFFPRDEVDLPVFLTTLLSIGLAAAVMTAFLRRLHPGSPWLRALLGTGYGTCAWALNDASADPMWLWGLVAIPMLGIVLDRALRGPLRPGGWIGGSLLVALAWFGNFYTASMASLCAVLVFLVRLWLAGGDRREKFRALLRAAALMATGLVLALPVLLVCLKSSRLAVPGGVTGYKILNPLDFAGQLLPGTRATYGVPYVAIGMLGLVLILAFPFMRRIRGLERTLWCGLLLVVAASFVWKPTILLWQGFAIPNGSPYREAFVLSALGTMVAWLALARRPRPLELLGGAVLTAVVALVAATRPDTNKYSWTAVLGFGTLTLLALLALHLARGLRSPRRRRWALRGTGAVLGVLVLGCSTLSVYGINALRNRVPFFAPHVTMDAASEAAHRSLLATDTWPKARTESGPHLFADNDPLLLGGEGGAYYSSYVPDVTAQTFYDLGMGWYMNGRHLLSPTDPGSRAIFGVSHALYSHGTAKETVQKAVGAYSPLVTVHHGGDTARLRMDDPFALQNLLLGKAVWRAPAVVPTPSAPKTPSAASAPTATRLANGEWSVPSHPAGGPWVRFSGSCAAGDGIYVNAPWYRGAATAKSTAGRVLGETALNGRAPRMTANPLRRIGTVPANGRFTVAFGSNRAQTVPAQPVGCLSPRALSAATAAQHATGATQVTAGGHGIAAELPAHSTGTAVFATTAVTGWNCTTTADDGRRTTRPGASYHGLLAAPLGAGSNAVSCSYTPPGLRTGLAGTGAALAALVLVPVGAGLRRRRGAGSPGAAATPDSADAAAAGPAPKK